MANPGPALVVPLQDYPISQSDGDGNGRVTLSWSRFFTTLAGLVGGSLVPVSNPVVIRVINPEQLGAYDATTGELLGVIPLKNEPGGIPQPVAITGSPQIYKAISDGTLVVFSTALEVSRDGGGTWFQVTLTGGALPLLVGDWARATWYDVATPPKITWFPTYAE